VVVTCEKDREMGSYSTHFEVLLPCLYVRFSLHSCKSRVCQIQTCELAADIGMINSQKRKTREILVLTVDGACTGGSGCWTFWIVVST
jgi:hypothetical protein